jgi:hypothetical protein
MAAIKPSKKMQNPLSTPGGGMGRGTGAGARKVIVKKAVLTPAQKAKRAENIAANKTRASASTPSVKVVKGNPGLAGNKNMVENWRVEGARSGFTARDEARFREARMVKGTTVRVNSAPKPTADSARAANARALKAANKKK